MVVVLNGVMLKGVIPFGITMILYHVWVFLGNGVSIVREVLRRSVVQIKRFRKDKTMKRKIMALGASSESGFSAFVAGKR